MQFFKTIRLLFLFLCVWLGVEHCYAQSSVLSQGRWFKLAIERHGVYKISYEQLRRMGFDINSDPRTIKIFGNAGGMLPQANSEQRPADLQQVSIFVSGENDGAFNPEDFILFYAEGADQVTFDAETESFSYESNLYGKKNFYFITTGGDTGQRITVAPTLEGSFPVVSQFDDYVYHEEERVNVLSSGREWFGERFDANAERTFPLAISGIVPNSTIKVLSDVMGQSFGESSFTLLWNDAAIGNHVLSSIPNTQYGVKGIHDRALFSINANVVNAPAATSHNFKYQFRRAASGTSAAYLDFFLVHVKRQLQFSGRPFIFRSSESVQYPVTTYAISGSAQCTIWNVTNPYQPEQQNYTVVENHPEFSAVSTSLQEYTIFGTNVPAPEFVEEVKNQNLHGLTTPKLIIVSHPDFISEASRLAQHRAQHNGFTTIVVTPQEIYNEFSSGRQDVTAIRDFIKYLYDKNPSVLNSILLFGKGSYDYKERIAPNTNFVPTYESRNSLSPLATYSSDDYYAFLENHEGNWGESPTENHTLDVGVGRLPVKTLAEAKAVVDKIIHYDTHKKGYGRWRKDIAFVGDDGNNADNFTSIHQSQANTLAESIETTNPDFNTKKIFLGSYEKTVRPNGEIIPEANEDILRRFDRGSLIINFTGHGNEKQWADEKVFSDIDIENLENHLYPFLVTATCEFGRQDDPLVTSSAELSVLHENGGAIGLVTTARPVNASTNFVLNREFYEALFQREDGRYRNLGQIFSTTKNNSVSGISNRNFSLLADPSMMLAMPEETVVVTKLQTTSGSDTLKALSTVIIKGEIQNASGTVVSDFNGILEFTLFDKRVAFSTVGKNNPPFEFEEWINALYRGKASVTDGNFEFQFQLTKNVADEIDYGKLSLYAFDPINMRDASGALITFKVGGMEPEVPADNVPPMLEAFMGDTTFVSGGIVSTNATLIVQLQDDSGINISESVGENGLVAYLDDESNAFILNDYYEAYMDDFTRGSVYFPMKGLLPGKHLLTVKAWDTHNNPGETSIEFYVTDGDELQIETFGNFPNPFQSETSIFFTHNRSGDDLQAQLVICSATGMQLKTYEFDIPASSYRVDLGQINDLYDFGKKLPGGLYLARLAVRSLTNGSKNERVTKLIVVN